MGGRASEQLPEYEALAVLPCPEEPASIPAGPPESFGMGTIKRLQKRLLDVYLDV